MFSAASVAYVANDPSDLTPNARVIGLGRAYVAVDGEYANPAGLASVKKIQISSMFGKFMEEYNYTSVALAYPTEYGVFGLGYSGASIGGAPATRIKPGTAADPVYEVDPTRGSASNTNNVYVLSYGTDAKRFVGIAPALNLRLGASLRIFQAALSGAGITDGSAIGKELDLGAQIQPKSWLKVGVVGKHLLPASVGGTLVYADGHTESYPATVTVGTAIKVLGDYGALRSFRGQEVTIVSDIKTSVVERANSTSHIGVEWKPASPVAIRVGIDQNTNLCAGVGVTVKGFRFDYGYNQYASAPGMSNNYFSVTYGLPVAKKKKLVVPVKKLELIRFKDVPESHWAYNQISLLATQGIIKGYPNQTFKPEGKITRAELSTLLVRSSDADLIKGKPAFRDVTPKHWAYNQVYTAAKLNIINGYPDYTFKPRKSINRAEGVSMVTRFTGIQKLSYKGLYSDIKATHWAARNIASANEAGLLAYVKTEKLYPKKDLTRAEVVEILYRTSKVQGILAKGILKNHPNAYNLTTASLKTKI